MRGGGCLGHSCWMHNPVWYLNWYYPWLQSRVVSVQYDVSVQMFVVLPVASFPHVFMSDWYVLLE